MLLKQKIFSVLLAGALIAPSFMQHALAATGVIYLTPASSSLQVGSSETLALRINPGTTVDGVQATVSYNPAQLQLNSVDNSSSPFSAQLQKSAGGGTITLALGNLSGGVSSDSLIAYINFTAVAGSGSASLSVSNANATSGGSYTNPVASGASISFTSPPAAPAPSSGGGSAGSTSGGSSSPTQKPSSASTTPGSKPGADPAAPAATTPAGQPTTAASTKKTPVKSKLVSTNYSSATLQVSGGQGTIYVLWGSDAGHISNKSSVVSGSGQNKITIGDGKLTPGTTYFYKVITEDAQGSQTASATQQLLTKGYTVRVTVLDGNSHALANKKVTLHSRAQTVTTDDHGIATFSDVAPGLHHIAYQTADKYSYSSPVFVEDTLASQAKNRQASLPAQNLATVLPVKASTSNHSNITTLLVAYLIVLSVGGSLFALLFGPLRGRHLAIHLAPMKSAHK